MSQPISWEILSKGDDTTTNSVISAFKENDLFSQVATAETQSIVNRDKEDDEKLAEGIKLAIEKKVLPADVQVEHVTIIDVLGKSANEVATAIVDQLAGNEGGKVIVFQGLSGTGKGTTVAKLQQLLPNAVTWSNGNVFRSLTLLAVTHCEQNGLTFSEAELTAERLADFVGMLSFDKFKDKYDIRINGLGLDVLVSEIVNTDLKSAKVTTQIPTVAKVTQGEVVKFADAAVSQLGSAGFNVLVEGRQATVDYIRSPFRFELILSDPALIGQRRCAQKMMAAAQKHSSPEPTPEQIHEHLANALTEIAKSWSL